MDENEMDISTIPHQDLINKYYELHEKQERNKTEIEELLQQNYSLKQDKNRLCLAEQYLQSELETINSQHDIELKEIEDKYKHQIEDLKGKNHDLLSDNTKLETKCNDLEKEVENLVQTLKEVTSKPPDPPKTRLSEVFRTEARYEEILQTIQNEKAELNQLVDTLKQQVSSFKESELKFKERILCLTENLEVKKSDLLEKDELIESLQQQNCELNLELSACKSEPANENRKGNSLFAEVDDQRQKMSKILHAQKYQYVDMKKRLSMLEIENRRLKKESENVKDEISKCSDLYGRAEQVYIQNLVKKNNQLMKENRTLEEKARNYEKALAKTDGMSWIESLINCSEVKDLKDKVYSFMMERNALDENLLQTQKELGKFRLEYIKLKFLINRIVDAYNVNLDEIETSDIHFSPEFFLSVKMEHEQSQLIQFDSKMDDETVLYVCNENESPEMIDLDETNLKEEAASVGLIVKIEPKTPLNEAYSASKSIISKSRKKLEEFLTPLRNSTKSAISTPTLLTEQQKIVSNNDENATAISMSPEKRLLSSEGGKSDQNVPPKKPKLMVDHSEGTLQEIIHKNSQDHPKSVTFSSNVQTKTIDSSAEATQARKKQGVFVKRIEIPSRNIKKEKENSTEN